MAREQDGQKRDEAPAGRRAETADQLRSDIDSGRTRDKVGHGDPAAAPLGTDAEAAGNPPTEEEVRLARERETGRSAAGPGARPPAETGARRNWALSAVILAVVLVAIAVILLW